MTGPAPPRAPARSLWLSGTILACLAVIYAWLVIRAPVDSAQGIVQKILYVHVPCALSAYLGFAVTAVSGVLYLWKNDDRYDRAAVSGAEVGILFCTMSIVTGPIWAKATWGHWWTWDPRLTVTLLVWFIYLAYLLLRSFTEGSARTARFAAVYGIVGFLAVPLNYFAIELFGGTAMHPDNLESGSLGRGMGWPFVAGVLTGAAAFAHLLLLRVDLEARRAAAAAASGEFWDS